MENGFKKQKDIKCCYLCKYSVSRTQVCLTCENKKAWIKETSVEPISVCDYFEEKENDKHFN